MNQTATNYMPEEQFNATLLIGDGYVHVVSRTLADLVKTVAQLRPTEAVGKTAPAKVKDETKNPEPKKEAAAQVEKPSSSAQPAGDAAPSGKSETTSSQPAAASSSSTDEPARPTYDDVKKAVLALAKISPDTAKATLAKFTGQNGQPCDHGTKMKLEDYPAFLAAADEHLKVAA